MGIFLTKNLKYLRKKSGQTQTSIGLQLNKAHTSIGNWEKGIAEPSLKEIEDIARIFEISMPELLFEDLENVHLNVQTGQNQEGKNVHLNVHGNVHLTGKKANRKPSEYQTAEEQAEYKNTPEESEVFWRNKYIALLEKQSRELSTDVSHAKRLEEIANKVLALQAFVLKHVSDGPCSQFDDYQVAAEFLHNLEVAIDLEAQKDDMFHQRGKMGNWTLSLNMEF